MGLKVLSALDTAKTQYYHFKAIIIAGMGLFTDAYDLFCITPVSILLCRIYYPHRPDLPPAIYSALVTVALAGTILGQLLFGRLGDLVGRRRVYGLALALMVLSSFASAFSISTSRPFVLSTLLFFRFLLGVGIGGDYPLSATIMSEFANKATRGAFIAAVFSMQGFGILVSSVVSLVVFAVFDRVTEASPERTPAVADLSWRIILMVGAIPAGVTFYWRMMMPETARYTALVEHNVIQATKDMEKVLEVSANTIMDDSSSSRSTTPLPLPSSTYRLFSKQFLHRHGRHLLSCAASWFLVDIIFYSNNLFQARISELIFHKNKNELNAYQYANQVVKVQAIIAICSTIPGYWATVCLIDRVGRKKIQFMGFVVMAAALSSIGGPYFYWNKKSHEVGIGFMALYGLTFFFSNFGPNTTTFIIPAELFPARFRATCHGISGAAGKVGAIIGSLGFLWASQKKDSNGRIKVHVMTQSLITLAVISLLGALVTFFLAPETKGRSLEENERDGSNRSSEGSGLVHGPQIQLPA